MNFENVTKGIYLLKTPFSTVWTGVTLLTGEKNFLIDSGSEEPEVYVLPALREIGMQPEDIDYVLHTHCHGDHISGHHTLANKYGRRTAVLRQGYEYLRDPAGNAIRIRTKFPEHSPKPQTYLKGVEADVVLEENETLEGRLFAIHTPGHEGDAVCWYDIPTKTIICGDSLQANGTPTQGIGFYQDLSAYRQSLEKLEGYDIENIICGHEYDGIGSVITGRENVKKALECCREYVALYDRKIRAYLSEGLTDQVAIAERLIAEVGCGRPGQLFLALYTVTQHLEEIENKNEG